MQCLCLAGWLAGILTFYFEPKRTKHINYEYFKAMTTATASAPMLGTPLSPRRGGNEGGADNATASSSTSSRKANIQVCVRLRPILPSDAPRRPASSAAAGGSGARRASRLPTPTKKGTTRPRPGAAGANTSAKNSAAATARFARTTESASHRTDDSSASAASNNGTGHNGTAKLALIPAWEVTTSSLHSTTDTIDTTTATDTIYQNPSTNPDPSRTSTYSFDRVFGPTTATSHLYTSTVSDVVRASMEGYHGSVFAYGQTSTGKTHTMTGTPDDPGIVPLAVRECFRYIRSANAHANNSVDGDEEDDDDEEESNREYLLRVSYLEIYNETIQDLLAPPPVPGPRGAGVPYSNSTAAGGGGGGGSTIRIFESKAEGVVVRGLREEVVTSSEQVFALLATGEARRRTGSTALNRASSRSHSIFRLIIESRARNGNSGGRTSRRGSAVVDGSSPARSVGRGNGGGGDDDSVRSGASVSTAGGAGGPVRVSSLSLVDLAGSESVKASGASGARAKEGQFINKSLLTLGHVIYKLSEMSSAKAERGALSMSTKHIPYRDSKLTRLLQPSLSGNAQICIICNVSPLERNLEESHNTLKFGLRAKKIKQNASINEVVDDRTLLHNYREEIEALKRQLREAKEAQAALQKERDEAVVSSPAAAPLDADDEDIQTLVEAIQNLEKLILRKATVKGTVEKPRAPSEKNGGGSRRDHLDRTGSFFASGNFESLLIDDDDDEKNGDINNDRAPRTPTTRRNLNKSVFEVSDLNAEASPDDDDEDDGMITELHRIQGLLGSVLKKTKSITTPSRPTMANASSAQNTPNRDEEVELLRSQLKEQEVATSLRKADSSFLQSQLQEKDALLQEVSKILDAVEKRQVELEKANSRMRQDLAEKNATIEYQSRQIEKLRSCTTAGKDDDEDLFDDLV